MGNGALMGSLDGQYVQLRDQMDHQDLWGTTNPQLGWTQSCILAFEGLAGDREDLEFLGLSWQWSP